MSQTTIPVTVNDIPNTIHRQRPLTPHLSDQEILEREVARREACADGLVVPSYLVEDVLKELVFMESVSTLDCIFDAAGSKGIETWKLPEILYSASTDFVPVEKLMCTLLGFLDVSDSWTITSASSNI